MTKTTAWWYNPWLYILVGLLLFPFLGFLSVWLVIAALGLSLIDNKWDSFIVATLLLLIHSWLASSSLVF